MQDRSGRKFKITIILLFVIAGIFMMGNVIFEKLFSQEISVTEDIIEKNYYENLLEHEGITSDWEPKELFGTEEQPEILGESGILVDINSGKILFEKKPTKKMKIASIVKIMTAIVALEHKKLDEEIIISHRAASIGENTMCLEEGEVYSLEELLYGLILNSGNDAAYAIAEGVAGNVENFVKWMNIKASELEMGDTEIFDPSGLNDDTYSTAFDLVKLSRYAMQNEDFKRIVGTFSIEFPESDKHKYVYLENQTNLLTTYDGVGGIKTGYTEEAGYCLVTYAKNEGIELVGVVLNSTSRKFDMLFMLNHGFSLFGLDVRHAYDL